MFDIQNHDMLKYKSIKASEMKTGQLFLLNDDPISTDYVKMAVCGFESKDDNDVKYIYPFNGGKIEESSELGYVDENRAVILVKATVSSLEVEACNVLS